jgi:hypothetical protein
MAACHGFIQSRRAHLCCLKNKKEKVLNTFNTKSRLVMLAAICVTLSACSTTQPVAYSGISSSTQLAPNWQDKSGRVPFSYAPVVNWHPYTSVIIDPVVIYHGPDQQFDDLSEADKEELGNYMRIRFMKRLQSRFAITATTSPSTLRVRLTLTGAKTTTPVLGTLSRFDIAGGIYNGVQNARDREGTLTGSVMYAVEIFDAKSDRLLNAYVTKQYPSPWNISASIGSLSASKAGIDNGAEELYALLK